VVLRLAPFMIAGPLLVVLAGAIGGPARIPLWIAALGVDYAGPLLTGGMEGWRVAPAHFAERHGLIVIIALGESVVAIGVGAAGTALTAGVVAAALLGMALVSTLWWAYFDVVAVVAERVLQKAEGRERAAMARDSYSYLHLPMIAGIVLVALGVKATLEDVSHPLDDVPAVCLCAGFALYLLGLIGFRLRNVRSLNRQRAVAVVLVLAVLPVALHADALPALATVTAIGLALIAYEALRFADARARVRSAA
jgi:low temperature requirement protein LtrA